MNAGKKSQKTKKKQFKIMLGCPEDAEQFIGNVKSAIDQFNEESGKKLGLELIFCHWKTDTHTSAENTQESINRQLCAECDYLIALFYKSVGHAVTSDKPGTLKEIDYFKSHGKQAFLFKFTGEVKVELSSHSNDTVELLNYWETLKRESKKLYFKEYTDGDDLQVQILNDLNTYFEKLNVQKKNQRSGEKDTGNLMQKAIREHICIIDHCFAIDVGGVSFSFLKKAESLIEGIQNDGSVQYYIGRAERFRTTPTASTLEALYLAGFLPTEVCMKMQDWVFNSRTDVCDDPDNPSGKSSGHEPDEKDQYGWSWNEGVSVWATSKALDTLILTKYYEREDVCKKEEILNTTYKALEWLADQQYPSGGWGFQHAPDKEACKESVTMTALTLRVITRFLMAAFSKSNYLRFESSLEKKLSEAKRKGIEYLIRTEKTDENGNSYWEYDGKCSLTGTVWVLDFINLAKRQEAGKLYGHRDKIAKFCINSLPSSPQGYEDYKEEIYFTGGITKYKEVTKYSKFYSYMPYHIPVILNSGVHFTKSELQNIDVCMKALIKGNDEYWNGTDNSEGSYQHPSCFARAMALYVVFYWMKRTWKKVLPNKLKGAWEV